MLSFLIVSALAVSALLLVRKADIEGETPPPNVQPLSAGHAEMFKSASGAR